MPQAIKHEMNYLQKVNAKFGLTWLQKKRVIKWL